MLNNYIFIVRPKSKEMFIKFNSWEEEKQDVSRKVYRHNTLNFKYLSLLNYWFNNKNINIKI